MSQSQVHKKLKDLHRNRLQKLWDFLLQYDSKIHFIEFSTSFVFALTLVLMIRQNLGASVAPLYKVGDVAQQTFRASSTLEVEDPETGQSEKSQILNRVAPVYDYDREAVASWVEQWKTAIRSLRAKSKHASRKEKVASVAFGFDVSAEEAAALQKLEYSADLEKSISFAMGPLWEQKIGEKPVGTTGIELMDLKTSRSSFVKSSELSSILSVDDARALVSRASRTESRSQADRIKMPWSTWSLDLRENVFALQSRLIRPNVTLNRKETEARKDLALKEYHPQMLRAERGEVIIREGERVTRRGHQLLQEINRRGQSAPIRTRVFFESLFAAFFIWLSMLFLRRQFSETITNTKNTFVAAGILLTCVASFKLAAIFQMNVVAGYFTNIPASFFLFLIPVAVPSMIVRLLIQTPFAALTAVVFAGATAVMLDGATAFGVHAFVLSLMSIHFLRYCPTRTSLHVAGLRSAVIGGLSSLAVLCAWSGEFPTSIALFNMESASSFSLLSLGMWTFAGGFIGGWLSSAIALMFTPILENILDYTTDLKLLELARMDNPLLRELVLKAPGTYHHSIVVGSLVEAACEAVGANALLARVGSYYHDIGKIGRAEYFVENQSGGHNPHDQISPHMSAKIIMSHVKEGKLMAEQAKLGENIVNFIVTHHGTGLVGYFYNKAKHEAAQPNAHIKPEEITEEDFRYPGPKPHTKEEAIVSLADSCEAATRSLVEPTPARIEGMVKKIISKAFNEGLLDEANITLREVNLVGRAFVRILMGIHHNRIQYPDQEQGLPKRDNTLTFIKSRRSS